VWVILACCLHDRALYYETFTFPSEASGPSPDSPHPNKAAKGGKLVRWMRFYCDADAVLQGRTRIVRLSGLSREDLNIEESLACVSLWCERPNHPSAQLACHFQQPQHFDLPSSSAAQRLCLLPPEAIHIVVLLYFYTIGRLRRQFRSYCASSYDRLPTIYTLLRADHCQLYCGARLHPPS
jgi:hypothetical protein